MTRVVTGGLIHALSDSLSDSTGYNLPPGTDRICAYSPDTTLTVCVGLTPSTEFFVEVWDLITDPASPAQDGSTLTQATSSAGPIRWIHAIGNVLYMHDNDTLWTIDIANTSSMSVLDSLGVGSGLGPYDFAINAGVTSLFIPNPIDDRLYKVNITTPSAITGPTTLTNATTLDGITGLLAKGGYVYCANAHTGRLTVVAESTYTIGASTVPSVLPLSGGFANVLSHGDALYVIRRAFSVSQSRMSIWDISTPSTPSFVNDIAIGTGAPTYAYSAAIRNNRLYIIQDETFTIDRIPVYNIEIPLSPTFIGGLDANLGGTSSFNDRSDLYIENGRLIAATFSFEDFIVFGL